MGPRPHPPKTCELFDVLVQYNTTGLTPEIVDCFLASLAGYNRLVHEEGCPAHQVVLQALGDPQQSATQCGRLGRSFAMGAGALPPAASTAPSQGCLTGANSPPFGGIAPGLWRGD